MTTNDSDLEGLISAFALGALSDSETEQVEALLATSEEARQSLRTYQEMLAILPPPRRAPARAEDAFRARLAGEANPPPNEFQTARVPKPAARPRRLGWIGAAAALIVVLVVGVLIYNALNWNTQTIERILASQVSIRVDLAAQNTTATAGRVSAVILPGEDQMVLVSDLSALANNRQYQLWFISDSGKTIQSGLVFDAGGAKLLVSIPDPTRLYTLGITIEPQGGSRQPTSAPIFVGQLPRARN